MYYRLWGSEKGESAKARKKLDRERSGTNDNIQEHMPHVSFFHVLLPLLTAQEVLGLCPI